ncbi:MAG: translation elongation factor Ts [bacterium]|nr:translation elongation factor Ts [candidate division WOR-3 bacterium]MDH5683289.1 translation elongation factor Ts [candidate division WOR-3 bacterium]
MSLSLDKVKELRARTGSAILDCKNALDETDGDIEKAIELLRKKGIAKAEKKFERPTIEGVVDSYIHPGERLGVIVEVNSETDFVARNQEFRQFVHDIAMQIAACDPLAVSREDLSSEVIEREKRIYESQAATSGKPSQVIEKIVQGKMEKFYADVCLLEQPFVKLPEKKVGDYLKEQIAKFGENIRIKRFVRFKLGE